MAIPLGGEPFLQATPVPGGRPEWSMGGPLVTNTELEAFALLMAGQAMPAETEALLAPKAKGTPALPGLQGQALPWEALAAAAEEAGQLMALLQSTAMGQPLPPAAPLLSSTSWPETTPPAISLPAVPAAPVAVALEATTGLAADAGAGLPAATASLAALEPSPGEAAPMAPPSPAGIAAQPAMQPAILEPELPSMSLAGQNLPPQEQIAGQSQEQAQGQAQRHMSAQTLPPHPHPPPAPSQPQLPPAATAVLTSVPAEQGPATAALPAVMEDQAAARSLPRPPLRSSGSLAQLAPAQPPTLPPAGMPQPENAAPQALAAPEDAGSRVPPPWPEPDEMRGPLLQKVTEITARLAVAGAEIPPPAGEIQVPSAPVGLAVEAGMASWTPFVQEAPAPRAPMQNQALAHPRLPPEATPQLVLRVKEATEAGVETVSVDLRPPELGRVELRLTFREGTVQVVMLAERAETFEALRQERHSLMQQMEQAGLQLGGQGLDLQHGSLSWAEREAPEPAQALQADAGPGEDQTAEVAAPSRRPASDSLIDIVA